MKLIPTKTQFKDWSLPSKIGYISFVVSIFAIILMIVFFIIQYVTGASKEGQRKIQNNLTDLFQEAKKINPQRIISDESILKLIDNLKSHSPLTVEIETTDGDKEAYFLAIQIKDIFKEAGWTVGEIDILNRNKPFRGIRVFSPEMPLTSLRNALIPLFNDLDVEKDKGLLYKKSLSLSKLEISVGSK